ncbi:MAG: EpsG family protein [Clostridia bacterium]|nr:EpsG family protein [Clostridia bacterium]
MAASFLLKGDRKQNKVFIIVAFILLFAVMGLRNVKAIGNDSSGTNGSYPIIYRRAGNYGWGALISNAVDRYNIGFMLFSKLVFEITGGDYQAFITIVSLIVMLVYSRFILKYSPSPIQSILCFLGLLYYLLLFDALKQALAMATLLLSFDAIVEKKPIKFIILTLLAAFIHFPALIFIPAYWIAQIRIGQRYIAVLAVLLFLTYVFRDRLLNLMLSAYGSDSSASMQGIRFLRNKALIMIAVVAFAVFVRPPAPKDTLYNALLMFAGIAIMFQTFCGYNNIFERLADYYFHTSIVFIPLIFEKGGKSESRIDTARNERIISYATLLICVVAIWRFLSYVNNAGAFNPYRFVWQ